MIITEESAIVFVLFIFFANYLLLNIMLAISCDLMKEVSQQQKLFQGECDTISTISLRNNEINNENYVKKSINKYLDTFIKVISYKHHYLYGNLITNDNVNKILSQKNETKDKNDIEFTLFFLELIKNNKDSKSQITLIYKNKTINLKNLKCLEIAKNIDILIADSKLNQLNGFRITSSISEINIKHDEEIYSENEESTLI